MAKFPAIAHRLKDLLDIVAIAETGTFEGDALMPSLRATFERRRTLPDVEILDEMKGELKGRRWETQWSTMLEEKAVARKMTLRDALTRFDVFARPLLTALVGGEVPRRWNAGGPWK